jgi:hypothetical protein
MAFTTKVNGKSTNRNRQMRTGIPSEYQEIEALLPWYAAGTLSRRDANRVEQALAGDRELARQYDLVREELVETIHLNETLGAPSARAMERLFAAIDTEEARAQRHRRWFDLGSRISEFQSILTPRTLAWSATAAAIAILVQAAVIAAVVVKEQGSPSEPRLASAPSEGSYAVVRFAPQTTADDITKFLGAYNGDLWFVTLFGAASVVTIIEVVRRLL